MSYIQSTPIRSLSKDERITTDKQRNSIIAQIAAEHGGRACDCDIPVPLGPAGICDECGVHGPDYLEATWRHELQVSNGTAISAEDEDSLREPPFVSCVRSVSFQDDSYTSYSGEEDDKPLTRHSYTSNTSNSHPGEASEGVRNLLSGVRTGDWLNEAVFEKLQYAVPQILPAGFAVLAGPPKAGKSWVALDWLLSVAAGGKALGKLQVGAPRRVLYLALEDSDRRMQERCFAILGDASVPELFSYVTDVEPGMLTATIEQQMELHPDTALIVIDTLGKVMPPMKNGDTTYQRDYRVGSSLHKIAKDHKGLSIVAVHHTRKTASTDFVDTVSGTNGLAGAADTIMVLSRDRNSSEGLLKVTGRDIEEAEYALTSTGGRWAIDGSDLAEAAEAAHERLDTDNLGGMSRDILTFVAAHPEGATSKQVADKFGQSAYVYLKRLLESGHIEKPERGRYIITGRK